MGFIKRSDGDPNYIIDRVFDDVDEVIDVIVEHIDLENDPTIIELPETILPSIKETN
jgi:hypothetical protein